MEKEMLEMFIYYVMGLEQQASKDYSLSGCIKRMEIALDIIKKDGIDGWSKSLEYVFSKFDNGIHPVLKKHEDLVSLNQEQYVQTLKNAHEIMRKYSDSHILNYDSLYLLQSEQDVEDLANKIIIRNKSTKEIEEKLEDKLAKEDTEKETVFLIHELSNRYYYGSEIKQDYAEAIKGWEMIYNFSNDAKYMLAICYMKGTGVKQDKENAYKIFSEIMNVNIIAKYIVARFTFLGEGTEKDYGKAFKIFNELMGRVPYDLNDTIKSFLGEMYFYGLGTEQDKEKGFTLLESAWNSGNVKLDYKTIKKVLKEYYGISD